MPDHLTATEYIVLTMLATYSNPDGTGAAPAATTLAVDCGKSVNTIRRSLAALVDKGYITVTRKGGGHRRPTQYALVAQPPHEASNVPTQSDTVTAATPPTYLPIQMGTHDAPIPTHPDGYEPSDLPTHLDRLTYPSEPTYLPIQMGTDQVDQEINQEKQPSSATHDAHVNTQPQRQPVSTTFSDGTPIGPEPPNNDPPPTYGSLALVHDADVPTEISATPKPAPGKPSPAALALVRTTVNPAVGRQIIEQLAHEVDRLRRDRNINPTDIATALTEWDNRPGAGPRLLPNLVADAARTRTTPVAKPASKLRALAELAAQARAEEQHTTRRSLE
jgi:DNA-binding MarR family transcriptional regulator